MGIEWLSGRRGDREGIGLLDSWVFFGRYRLVWVFVGLF